MDVGLGIEETRYRVGITAEAATLPGAVELDQVRNPLVAVPRAVGMTVEVTHMFLRGLGQDRDGRGLPQAGRRPDRDRPDRGQCARSEAGRPISRRWC